MDVALQGLRGARGFQAVRVSRGVQKNRTSTTSSNRPCKIGSAMSIKCSNLECKKCTTTTEDRQRLENTEDEKASEQIFDDNKTQYS